VATETVPIGGMEAQDAAAQAGTRTDILLRGVLRIPGPALLSWAAFGALLLAVGHMILWAVGAGPWGSLEPEIVPSTLMLCYLGWFLHLLNSVAMSAVDQFAPALEPGSPELALARRRLTSIPDRTAIVAAVGAFVLIAATYFGLIRPLRDPLSPAVEAVSFVLWASTSSLLGVVIVHALRQLLVVRHLHAIASSIDIFRPGPVHAFSRLTAVSALGVASLAIVYATATEVAVRAAGQTQPLAQMAQEMLLLGFAAALFVLPLLGMHDRLASEKARLVGEAQARVKLTLARVDASVGAGNTDGADRLHAQLTSVLAELEFVRRLSTWPWATGTFRGVASALLLPIAIFLITRLLDRLV
jgi:hypothetical protein